MDTVPTDNVENTYSIHVRTPSKDIYQKVVESLSPLGVEIVAGETDPLVMALFFLSRMNAKFDNLGQLRHLYKIVQNVTKLGHAAETHRDYLVDVMTERRLRQRASIDYARRRLVETHLVENLNMDTIKYLTFEEIDKLYGL